MRNNKLLITIVGLLIIQFVLGMLANLYSTIPTDKPYEVFHQLGYINIHAINGTLLILLGIVFLVKSRKSSSFKPAAGGLASMVVAYIFGELFLFTQIDIFSLLMSIAFIGALFSYMRLVFSKK